MSSMYFAQYMKVDEILSLIKPKITALMHSGINGIVIDIKKNQRKRTVEQNKYLWAIYKNIVDFYNETGFIPDDLKVKTINSDFLHEYFKARFDVKETKKLTTVEFCEYTDKIQLLMTEQSKREYDPIYPEQPLQELN